jgi:hypothetical protein
VRGPRLGEAPELLTTYAHLKAAAALANRVHANRSQSTNDIMEPVIFDALHDLADAAAALGEKCLSGMSWNRETVRDHLDGSLAALVTRATQVGYDQAAVARGKIGERFGKRRAATISRTTRKGRGSV